jgi:hypothetical protein
MSRVVARAVRLGAAAMLLLAALSLAANATEYRNTGPALRHMAADVLPPLGAGVLALAAVDGSGRVAAIARWLAPAAALLLLARVLPWVLRGGAPPVALMLAATSALLASATLAWVAWRT